MYLHVLHSSGCLNGNAKPLSIATNVITGGFTRLYSELSSISSSKVKESTLHSSKMQILPFYDVLTCPHRDV